MCVWVGNELNSMHQASVVSLMLETNIFWAVSKPGTTQGTSQKSF